MGGEGSRAGSKTAGKKGGEAGKKGGVGLPPAIESDLSYHAMLGQHIRSSLPDSRNLSAEMLMQLGLPPKETLEPSRGKEGEKKKRGTEKGG